MPESSNNPTLIERLNALRRRAMPMVATFGVVLSIAVLLALLWPPSYRAIGTILIEQQELPTDLVRSTISSFADQRLQVITQRVMTSENLFDIIKRYDLYAKMRRRKVREEVIDRMRDDISFNMISADVIDPRSGHPTKATIAFSVGYKNRSPQLAAKVANELVSLYLRENLQNRQKRAADATSFLSDEANRLAGRIDELQKQLAEFKEKHLNDLPELSSINIQLMNRTQDDVRDVDTQIRSLEQQIVYLDAQLAQISPTSQVYTSTGERVLSPADRLKFLRTEYARVKALYAPTHPDVVRLRREIAGLEQQVGVVDRANDLQRQLEDAQSQLAAAKERYADDHPDVVRLNRLVEALTAQRAETNASVSVPKTVPAPDNPAYIQIKAQREASGSELQSLRKKRDELQARLRDLERRLENAPGVERDYTVLLRDLDNTQLKYRDVRQKQMEAQVSQNLEDERKGERFTLIEPPLLPEKPSSPNRALIVVAGLIFALGASVGVAFLLEMLDTSVRSKRELQQLLNVPPLAVLPWIETKEERRMRARRRRFALTGAITTVVLLVVSVHFFYRPLDVLWQVALRRLG